MDKRWNWLFLANKRSRFRFRDFNAIELQSYIKTKQWENSSGAYTLEGFAIDFVESLEGDYFTVLGLPLLPLIQALRQKGIHPKWKILQ